MSVESSYFPWGCSSFLADSCNFIRGSMFLRLGPQVSRSSPPCVSGSRWDLWQQANFCRGFHWQQGRGKRVGWDPSWPLGKHFRKQAILILHQWHHLPWRNAFPVPGLNVMPSAFMQNQYETWPWNSISRSLTKIEWKVFFHCVTQSSFY